jgi:hypothetical protein
MVIIRAESKIRHPFSTFPLFHFSTFPLLL